MSATQAPPLGDTEHTAKSEASTLEQIQDRSTAGKGIESSGKATDTYTGMDHGQENHHTGPNQLDPSPEPIQGGNEVDDVSTSSGSELDDDDKQPQPLVSDRKRTQYKKFSSWSVPNLGGNLDHLII